jgi:hypothetical protein
VRGGRPGGLDQYPTNVSAAGLADATVHGCGIAGLTHPGVEPDVGDQFVRVSEAVKVTDRGDDGDRGDRVDARDGHQAPHRRIIQGFDCQLFGHDCEFLAVEVQLAH